VAFVRRAEREWPRVPFAMAHSLVLVFSSGTFTDRANHEIDRPVSEESSRRKVETVVRKK
jgi:hypothetical protein